MGPSFQDLNLKPVYRTGEDNLFTDFYRPLLSSAIRYDRAVGFFSSEILSCNLKGLSSLVRNNGRMRLIIGEPLEKDEYEAILHETMESRQVLTEHYINKLIEMMDGMEANTGRLQVLAYLVASKRLEIKFAVRPKGMFHEKIGVVYDEEDNCVVFQGSANETPSALFEHINAESVSVYKSWQETVFEDYGKNYIRSFEQLWEGNREDIVVLDVVSKQYERIADYISSQIKQSKNNRLDFEKVLLQLDDNLEDGISLSQSALPKVPEYLGTHKFDIRPHQREALNSWRANQFTGILKHATGSGKTITSIYALTKMFEAKQKQDQSLIVMISVPYIDLAKQWVKELKLFNITPIQCFDSRSKWEGSLARNLQLVEFGSSKFVCILVVNKTLCSDHFQKAIKDINLNSLMFIGDECHRHGANQTRSLLPDAAFKLGLSATPFNDDEDMLESPFGNDAMDNILSYYQAIVHEYSLEDAILDEVLTPYDYHIIPIHLTEVEQEEYDQLSESIRKIMINSGGNLSKDNREKMVTLTSKRSRLLGSAENKMFKLRDITSNISKEKRKLTLFYVGEGKDSEDNIIIDQVTKTLRDNDWKTAQFTGKTTKRERDELLHLFKQRRVDALIAMKVLDEGIDVPACSTAYILASTKNPRQYVQRRGRVLRKFPGKTKATIHDFVVLPCPYSKSIFGKKLYESELERVRDFSLLATNKIEIESHLQELEVLRV